METILGKLSYRLFLIWLHVGHVGAPKQWIGRRELFPTCKSFPFFHEIWIAADQVIEKERTILSLKVFLDPPHLKSMVLIGNVRVIQSNDGAHAMNICLQHISKLRYLPDSHEAASSLIEWSFQASPVYQHRVRIPSATNLRSPNYLSTALTWSIPFLPLIQTSQCCKQKWFFKAGYQNR